MIGLLASGISKDPDNQQGENLKAWLARNHIGKATVLPFDRLDRMDLGIYSGLWWHHTAGEELPEDALNPNAVEKIRTYINTGGKVFLSRGACTYVESLNVDRPPDIRHKHPPRFFLRPGMHLSDPGHPLMAALPTSCALYNHLTLSRFCDLAWQTPTPGKARILGAPLLNGAVFRDQGVCCEWSLGFGRVLAFSGVALHFHDREDPLKPHLVKFAANIKAYLVFDHSFSLGIYTAPPHRGLRT